MVLIRYMVFVPFFMVNISAAVLGVSFPVFFITTFFATIPGSLLFWNAKERAYLLVSYVRLLDAVHSWSGSGALHRRIQRGGNAQYSVPYNDERGMCF
jgi:hypothetical protein